MTRCILVILLASVALVIPCSVVSETEGTAPISWVDGGSAALTPMELLSKSRKLKTTAKAEESQAGGKLRVTVTGSVTFDPQTGQYTYTYQVENESNSVGSVEWFGIRPLLVEPVSWTAPDHWTGEYGYAKEEPTGFVWWISDPGPALPDWIDEGSNTYASEYGADPGDTLTFSISLPLAPAPVDFTVQVWTDEEPAAEGTAWHDPNQTFFSMGATGTVVGPGRAPKARRRQR